MKIRAATKADIASISAIYAESWKSAYRGMVAQSYLDDLKETHWVEKLGVWMEENRYRFLLVCEEQTPVGAAVFGRSPDEKCPADEWAEIQSLYLRPAYWGKGYGTALFTSVMDALRADGFRYAYLWALRENTRAKGFYQKHGFNDNGDRWEVAVAGETLVDERFVREL